MGKRSLKYLFVSLIIFVLASRVSYAQSEWEKVSDTYFRWGKNNNVSLYSNSLTRLSFWNYHAETKANQKTNRWHHEDIDMNLAWSESRPWKVSFKIANKNNRYDFRYRVYNEKGKAKWHKESVYWGFKVYARTSSGMSDFTKYYCDGKSLYSNASTWDSDSKSWRGTDRREYRSVTIESDGKSTIKVYVDGQLCHTFYNARSLSTITICAGTASHVEVTDFSAQRMTLYAMAKPFITSGDAKYDRQDYWGAAIDYSKAIEAGYKCYDIYYRRGSAYYMSEFYANAIDDYTLALAYEKTEEAYFFRGLAKMYKNDPTAIDDLKKGGYQGQALVRELESEGRVPSSSPFGGLNRYN